MDGLWAVVVCVGALVGMGGLGKSRVVCCVMWGRGGGRGVVSSCGVMVVAVSGRGQTDSHPLGL